MTARHDYPPIDPYGLAPFTAHFDQWVVMCLEIDRLREERDRFREGYRRLRIAQAMETDEEAEAHAAAVPDFT